MIKLFTKKRNKKGFTLIELVVVIAILGILMALAIPRLGAFRKDAKIAANDAAAASIAHAVQLYTAANNITVDATLSWTEAAADGTFTVGDYVAEIATDAKWTAKGTADGDVEATYTADGVTGYYPTSDRP